MKVYVYPADQWACGHYRMIWPAAAVAEQFHHFDVTIVGVDGNVPDELKLGGRTDSNGYLAAVQVPEDAELVVLQRPSHRYLAEGVALMRQRGITVVVDMDDDLSKIHPSNPAFNWLHPKYGSPDHSWQHVELACRNANLVTVSTPSLLSKYAAHGRGMVVENAVPGSYLGVKHPDDGAVTWCGSLHSHPDDLRQLGSAFSDLHRAGVRVGCVGGGEGVTRALGLPYGALEVTGVVPIEEWPAAVARSLVTVTPLSDTQFNASKSWLKPLEAMACGVPVVMSPRAEYRRLHELSGVGFLVDRPKHWTAALKRLTGSAELRAEQSQAGREFVREQFTIERQAQRWAAAWNEALIPNRSRVLA